MNETINDGAKLWCVTFITRSNQLRDRLIIAKPDSSYEELETIFLNRFPLAKQIETIDEWDSVIVF